MHYLYPFVCIVIVLVVMIGGSALTHDPYE